MTEIIMKPEQRKIVQEILQQYIPHYAVWAFGSRVGGYVKPYSDLDLAVIAPQSLSLAERAGLTDAFSQSDLPWKVDIVDWQLISPEFQNIIKQNYAVLQTAS